jgi:hypothetical protein
MEMTGARRIGTAAEHEGIMTMPQGSNPSTPPNETSLSDTDISLLCDIGEFSSEKLDEQKARRLQRLIVEGFVEPVGAEKAPAKYQLTTKAQEFLSERGAGLNES